MAYQFDTQITGSTKTAIRIPGENPIEHQLNGIAAREQDANVIMGGLSTMYNIVGWIIGDDLTTRTVKQDVYSDE